jgi:hypothetical protein
MKRRTTLKTIGGIAGAVALGPSVVSADEPWPREESGVFLTHQQVQDELDSIQRRSRVEFELEDIGESLEGRELTVARVGEGDTDVFITTEQHGDEPTGTLATLRDLEEFAVTNSPYARTVRENLTVHALLMHNPDGAMRNQRENARPEEYTWEDPYFGEQTGPADPNRQHYFEFTEEELQELDGDDFDADVGIPDENPSPETQAMLEYVLDLDPLWVADLHTQSGMYHSDKENPGHLDHSSNAWPFNTNIDEEDRDIAKKMNVAMYDRGSDVANANVTLYDIGGTTCNIARNAHGAYGFGSILNEMTGQVGDRGERREGQMVRINREENRAILEETADGSLFDREPDDADEIPDRGDWAEWPWEREEPE